MTKKNPEKLTSMQRVNREQPLALIDLMDVVGMVNTNQTLTNVLF